MLLSSDPKRSAQQIRTARQRAAHTQREAAQAMGVSDHTVKSWESGRNQPTTRNQQAVEDYLTRYADKRETARHGEAADRPPYRNVLASPTVAEPRPSYETTADPGRIMSDLHGRLRELMLQKRFWDARIYAVVSAVARYGVTLPEDEAEDILSHLAKTGSDRG